MAKSANGPLFVQNLKFAMKIFWNNIVVTMKSVHVAIRQIGSSQGVVIPKLLLAQRGFESESGVEMTIEEGALVLRKPTRSVRVGWATASTNIAEANDDELCMGEFSNESDGESKW